MLFLVFFKALSVMFHAIDFRFLDIEGQTDAWTIIFYIVHLLKVPANGNFEIVSFIAWY